MPLREPVHPWTSTFIGKGDNMLYLVKRFALILALPVTSFLLLPSVSVAKGGNAALMPPNSHAFGKSFEEWNVLQTQWVTASSLGGTQLTNPVKRVFLLPGDFVDKTPVFNVKLPPGTPFVAAPFFIIGERYDDPAVPDDDPDALADVLDLILEDAHIHIELDGAVVLDGFAADLEQYLFGPTYFDNPIPYNPPQNRGPGLNAVAALWVTGVGATYHPLSVGKHTLVYTVTSAFFGDSVFTYNITVSPK
jgi:hypothetical protein